jgi:signal transduction histidine kinase
LSAKRAWLFQLAKATGLQHVALTDSLGSIYISSQPELVAGTSLMRYGADPHCFDSAAHSQKPIYCSRREAKVSLQSLYHPFDFFGTQHLIVLESDSNLLAYLEQYRTFIWAVALFLFAILAGLIAALVLIEGKARAALQWSRRNEQLAFLGRTSAELAHELKNPLAIIKTSVDVLRQQFDPERKNQAMHFLSDEVMRLSRLISNILGLSKDRELNIRPFAPGEVIQAATHAVQEIHPDVQFRQTLEAGVQVRGDLDAVRQIVENLMRNAAQAMGGHGTCHVLCESEGDRVHLYLGDEGPGIPVELRKTLFDPFVSGNKAGTGLGLAIVRSLVDRMGWTISALHGSEAAKAMGNHSVKTCFNLTAPKGVGAV